MKDSRITELLSSLSSEEVKRFREFLNSPFHNKNKRAIQLYELLIPFYPEFSGKGLTKESLFRKAFADKGAIAYNDSSMRSLLSDLAVLCCSFLSVSSFERDQFARSERLIRELGSKKLKSEFTRQLKALSDKLSYNIFEGEDQLFREFLAEDITASALQYSDNLNLPKTDHLRRSSDLLTYYFIIYTVKSHNFNALQKQQNINAESGPAAEIVRNLNRQKLLEYAKSNSDKEYCVLKVYLGIFDALDDPGSDEKYFLLKKSVSQHGSLFSPLEMYGICASLTNCCVQRIDLGKNNFFRECLEVYKSMLDRKLFDVYPGYFPVSSFTAIMNVAFASGEPEFAERFAEEYSARLHPENTKSVRQFSIAQIAFANRDYAGTLEHLSKTDFDYSNLKFHVKALALKSYYELKDFESLFFTTDSFSHFLRNNRQVNSQFRKSYLNFLRALENLARYQLKGDKAYLNKAEDIIREGGVASVLWLRTKLSEA